MGAVWWACQGGSTIAYVGMSGRWRTYHLEHLRLWGGSRRDPGVMVMPRSISQVIWPLVPQAHVGVVCVWLFEAGWFSLMKRGCIRVFVEWVYVNFIC